MSGMHKSHLAFLTLALSLSSLASSGAQTASPALPPIETALSDERGRVVVNGKPFFPILLYSVPTDPESLRRIHDHGFNMVTVAQSDEADAARAAGMYAAAHGRKIEKFDSILLAIGMDSPVLNLKPPLLDNLRADLEKTRAQIPNRPVMHAIGYWLNEPAGVIAGTLPPVEKYEGVVQAIDVAAPYLYPVPYQPIRSVGEAVGRASLASGGKKPLIPILQIFTWTVNDRYPTAAELKCMVWLSLIHGARGIGYYSFNHVTGKKGVTFAQEQPEVWASLKDVNAELAQLGPFLLDSAPDASVTLNERGAGVEMHAVSRDGSRLVLLANPTDAAMEVTLTFSSTPDGFLKPIGAGAEIAIHGGVAKVKLKANGTAALRNQPAFFTPPALHAPK